MALVNTLWDSVFNNTLIGGADWLIGVGALFLTIILITRNSSKWGSLLFPVSIMLHTVGITQSYLILVIGGLVFAQQTLSLEAFGNIVSGVGSPVRAISKLKPPKVKLTDREKYYVKLGDAVQKESIKKSVQGIFKK